MPHQADRAVFKSKAFDEEACEKTDAVKSAKAKFDKSITKLAATCEPALIASASSLETALLSGPTSLDAQSSGF